MPPRSSLDPWLRRYGWWLVLALILMPFIARALLIWAGRIR